MAHGPEFDTPGLIDLAILDRIEPPSALDGSFFTLGGSNSDPLARQEPHKSKT